MRSLVAATVLVSLAALAQPGPVFPSKEEQKMARILEPQTVSAEAKSFIKGKMKAHNKDMRDLVLTVATLKFDEAKKYAQGIANAPRLDASSGPSLDLPPAFFTLQDALRKQAGELITACDAKNADALVSSFTQMISTCMSCHNAFLVPMRDTKAPPKGAPAKK